MKMPTMGLYRVIHAHGRRYHIYINTNTSGIDDFQLIDEISKN